MGKLVCAWCNKKIRDIELVTGSTSHGICPACLLEYFGMTPSQLEAQTDLLPQHSKRRRRQLRGPQYRATKLT